MNPLYFGIATGFRKGFPLMLGGLPEDSRTVSEDNSVRLETVRVVF